MEKTFTIGASFSRAWQTARAHLPLLTKATLSLAGVFVVSMLFHTEKVSTSWDVIAVLVSVASMVFGVVLTVGFVEIAIALARGKRAVYADLIPSWHTFWRFVIISILVAVMVCIGIVALIIPGVYLLVRLSMARLAAIEDPSLEVFESLHVSSQMTEGVKWELLGLYLVVIFINFLGVLPFGLGLLFTLPLSMLAVAHAYVSLSHKIKKG